MKIIITIAIILASAITAFPCGAMQTIRGQVTQRLPMFSVPVYRAKVELFVVGEPVPVQVLTTSPFGYYEFDAVLPCSPYDVRVSHKQITFNVSSIRVVFPDDHSGAVVNFTGAI